MSASDRCREIHKCASDLLVGGEPIFVERALGARMVAAREVLDRGDLLLPSGFEALFLSTAHTHADIDHTVAAARERLAAS